MTTATQPDERAHQRRNGGDQHAAAYELPPATMDHGGNGRGFALTVVASPYWAGRRGS